jgi:hypothetical protein
MTQPMVPPFSEQLRPRLPPSANPASCPPHAKSTPHDTRETHHHRHSVNVSYTDKSIHAPPPSPTSNEPNLHRIPARPEPVYLSPLHSHQRSPHSSSAVTVNECCAPRPAQAPLAKTKMGLSKSQRIGILLGIDSAFFLVELCVGMWQSVKEMESQY